MSENWQPEQLDAEFTYEDGILYWKKPRTGVVVGAPVGSIDTSTGYNRTSLYGKKIYVHQLVWALHNGGLPTKEIDHINHNKLDNRIENLREVSHKENGKNQSLSKNNTSGYSGVCWYKSRSNWAVSIKVDGANKFLGYFNRLEDAVAAKQKANAMYGFHFNHDKKRGF